MLYDMPDGLDYRIRFMKIVNQILGLFIIILLFTYSCSLHKEADTPFEPEYSEEGKFLVDSLDLKIIVYKEPHLYPSSFSLFLKYHFEKWPGGIFSIEFSPFIRGYRAHGIHKICLGEAFPPDTIYEYSTDLLYAENFNNYDTVMVEIYIGGAFWEGEYLGLNNKGYGTFEFYRKLRVPVERE